MTITPTSRIILLKNPIEIDYMNELTFTSLENQYNYFYNLPKLECENATYQRKDEVVRFPTGGNNSEGVTYEDLLEYNYCMYQNSAFDDKWFYAFVKNVTFDNPGMSYIELETDVYQTWLFDLTFKNSYVEREHVNNDTVGLHTVPEGLELGEFIVNSHLSDNYNNDLTIVMGATLTPGEFLPLTGGIYGGIYSGIKYYRYDSVDTLNTYLNQYQDGRSDAVIDLFLAPKWLCGGNTTNIPIANSNSPSTQDLGISKITSLNGYTPKNKKLLTSPFCYIIVSNSTGQANTLRQEVWNTNNNSEMVLRMYGTLTPGCSIRAVPINYNGTEFNYDESITLGKFPQLNWATDQYTNWLTQQGVSIGAIRLNAEQAGVANGVANIIGGTLLGSRGDTTGGTMVGSGINGIYSTMQESYRRQLVPNTIEGNINSGDVTTGIGANRFHCYKMSIKQEYAKIIDDYMSAYGYKVNSYKIPNMTGRRNWNYVKTIGCNIEGTIPQNDMQKIKQIFNNGVTLWHNPNTFLDYSQDNSII